MFRVKICGLRQATEVATAAEIEQSAIGLNFYPPSVRYVNPESELTELLSSAALAAGVLRVGVFVNESVERILAIRDQVEIDVVQLHGDEPIEIALELIARGSKVIRAIKLPRTPLTFDEISAHTAVWQDAGCHLLLDADAGAEHGGSGKTLDWESVGSWASRAGDMSWTLAGGLNPDNVSTAIQLTGATSVDTASGVESQRGVKSLDLVRQFCRAAAQSLPSV